MAGTGAPILGRGALNTVSSQIHGGKGVDGILKVKILPPVVALDIKLAGVGTMEFLKSK